MTSLQVIVQGSGSAHGSAKLGEMFAVAGANQWCKQAEKDQKIARTVLELLLVQCAREFQSFMAANDGADVKRTYY